MYAIRTCITLITFVSLLAHNFFGNHVGNFFGQKASAPFGQSAMKTTIDQIFSVDLAFGQIEVKCFQ